MLVEAASGATVTATVEWQEELASEDYRLRLRPQPHLIPATLAIDGEDLGTFTTERLHPLETGCRPAG